MRKKNDSSEHVRELALEGHEDAGGGMRRWGAVTISILAALLAVSALLAQRAIKNEIAATVRAAAARSSLETAQLLQATNQRTSDELQAIAQLPGEPDATRAMLQSEAQTERSAAAQAASDPAGGQGVAQITQRLNSEESNNHHADNQAVRFEYAEVLLEIAIVLGSLSLLVLNRNILLAGVGIGLVGMVFMIAGALA